MRRRALIGRLVRLETSGVCSGTPVRVASRQKGLFRPKTDPLQQILKARIVS